MKRLIVIILVVLTLAFAITFDVMAGVEITTVSF